MKTANISEPAQKSRVRIIRKRIFLLDVLLMGATAFGGPGAHLPMFIKTFVEKRNYLTLRELMEYYTFCSLLPGPSSTQIILSMGIRFGGYFFGALAMGLWILPSFLIMTSCAVVFWMAGDQSTGELSFLRLMGPMVIGFLLASSIALFRGFAQSKLERSTFIVSAVIAAAFPATWIFPLLLAAGGFVAAKIGPKLPPNTGPVLQIRWKNLTYLLAIFILLSIAGILFKTLMGSDNPATLPVLFFQNTYRFGAIVIGGGQVLIPMMYEQFVNFHHYVSAEVFMTGLGIQQATPGPVFSFASYIGAMAHANFGLWGLLLGAFSGMVAIFLPGLLLVNFFWPFWSRVKQIPVIQNAFVGVSAAAAGLVLSSVWLLGKDLAPNWLNVATVAATFSALHFFKIPTPIIVGAIMLIGWLSAFLL